MRKIFAIFAIILFLTSCEKNDDKNIKEEVINESFSIGPKGIIQLDGRVLFQSKEQLKEQIVSINSLEDKALIAFSNDLNMNAFQSLVPIITEENEEKYYNHLMKEQYIDKETDLGDVLDDIEDIIADDSFSLLLNRDGEIQIADDVYKYTDTGLFIVPKKRYSQLNEFLNKNKISKTPYIKTEVSIVTEIIENNRFGIKDLNPINISSDILYYRKPYKPKPDYSKYEITSNGPISEDPEYDKMLSSLPDCSPRKTVWNKLVSSLFGDNDVCTDKYERKRRVKTKSYNQDFKVYFATGVKVKHQYRGWTRIWRKERIGEIRMRVEAAQFDYDPGILSNHDFGNDQANRSFYAPNSFRVVYNPLFGTYSLMTYDTRTLNSIFKNNLTIDFFGTGNSYLDNEIQNGINSNTSAQKLNEWFYTGIYQATKGALSSYADKFDTDTPNRTLVVKFPRTGKFSVQVSKEKKRFNQSKVSETFDWGIEVAFSYNNPQSWSDISYSGGTAIVKPENFRIKVIGAVKTSQGWKGSKLNVGL